MHWPFRVPLRNLLFRTLRQAFQTDDGREIAVEALNGLTAWRAPLPSPLPPMPYPDLVHQRVDRRDYAGTVFVTARFRTGSTLLWNIFRHIEGCVAYYEPLNERRWFDAASRGNRVDRTHRGVEDYWREYAGLGDLASLYQESWVDHGLVMGEGTWNPALRAYFDRLVEHADPARCVLQCNRIDFRLPWVRQQFPGARLVHLYRHPRDQWCSSLGKSATVPRDVTLDSFEPFDGFYLRRWARDLSRHFPMLAAQGGESAYRAFYLIWRLSYALGATHADHSLSFEDLVQSPRESILRLAEAVSISVDVESLTRLVSSAPIGEWRRFADETWFRRHEAACEKMLAEFSLGGDSD